MVQRANNPLQQGDFPYQRENNWHTRTPAYLDIPHDRFPVPASVPVPTPLHAREQTIEAALRDCAGIPVKSYALIVKLDNGEDRVYSSPSLADYRDRLLSDNFRKQFNHCIKKAEHRSQAALDQDNMFATAYDDNADSGYDRKHSSGESSSEYGRHVSMKIKVNYSDGEERLSARKRRFLGYRGRDRSDNDVHTAPVPVKKTQQLMIGDSMEVEKFYQTRFRDMQQGSCKVMGKSFVKLMEPKKQTHHPYTKGAEKAPPWWPDTAGPDGVRHREPDHLLKPERIRLLVHILKIIVLPNAEQPPSVREQALTVAKLEENTMEAMSNWFGDKEHPGNASKKPFLREIFKVAKAEERYRNGELDGTTYLSVMYGEGTPPGEESDEEGDNGAEEDNEECPTSAVSMSMTNTLVSPIGNPNDDLRMPALPMRQIAQPQIHDHGSYTNDPSPTFYPRNQLTFQPQSPGLQDRRQFVNQNFPCPQQQTVFGGWPTSLGGTGQSYYTTSPQQLPPTTTGPYLPPPHNFDGLPQGRFDIGPFRTTSISQPHQMATYDNYIHEHHYQQHEHDLKEEQHLHHSQ